MANTGSLIHVYDESLTFEYLLMLYAKQMVLYSIQNQNKGLSKSKIMLKKTDIFSRRDTLQYKKTSLDRKLYEVKLGKEDAFQKDLYSTTSSRLYFHLGGEFL